MNALGIALVWCVVQVTLAGLLAGGVYLVLRKLRPAAGVSVTLTGLLIIVALSAMALSPWPRWSLGGRAGEAASASLGGEPGVSPAGNDLAAAPVDEPSLPASAAAGGDADRSGASSVAVFFQALVDELTAPPPSKTTWQWPAALAVLFLVAAGLAAVWLAAGLLAVRIYRVRSRPVEHAALLELADVVCAELGCRRPIELCQSDALVTAATIGWRRPVVLLPADWTGWTDEQRRAVLAHEIAHIRNGHFLGVLCGQLGLVLHFYHPLVHWLMRRLRLEQELAADAAAAGALGGQRNYLTAIAELALRQQDRPLLWPARSFLPTRNTFLRRIAMLRDSKLRQGQLSPVSRALAIGTVLLCGLLAAGLRGPASPQQAIAWDAAPKEKASRAAIDVSWIPSDAVAIAAFRPAAIFRHPELDEFRKLLNQPGRVGHELTLPVEKIDQFTYVVLDKPDPEEGMDSEAMVAMVRAVEPYKFEDLIRKTIPDATAKELQGATYYVSAAGKTEHAAFRPDDQTVTIGTEANIRKVIRSRGGPLPKILGGRKAWRAFQKDHAVVAVDASAVARVFAPMGAGFAAPFAPLWENTTTAVVGVWLDDQVKVHAVATSDDEQGATKVEETLKAVQVLVRNFMAQLRQKAGQYPESEQVMASSALAALDLVSNATVQREGNVVRVESSGDLSSLKLGSFGKAVVDARDAARRAQSTNNLKQIGLAMHNFHDAFKCFPPAVLHQPLSPDTPGETQPYSWRVALLPYLQEMDLYRQYRSDEPWDSPANLEVLKKMPAVYRNPKDPADSTNTSYFALVGPGTVFSGKGGRPPIGGTPISEIRDGTAHTLLIVEAKRSVPWTKPEDIPYDPEKPIPELGGYFEGGFLAVLCDGSARFIPHDLEEAILRAMITKSDGQRVDLIPQDIEKARVREMIIKREGQRVDQSRSPGR